MPSFVLANRGALGSGSGQNGEQPSCDPAVLEVLAEKLRIELDAHGLPSDVHLNLVFKGGYITDKYSTLRNTTDLRNLGIDGMVHSFMVEYDGSIVTDQETLEPISGRPEALKHAFSEAMKQTCELVLT